MNFLRGIIQGVKAWTGKPLATPETDPAGIIGILNAMPNPDPILRHLGEAETVYASIMADAHVMGEVRSVRGSFRSHQWRIVAGQEDDARSQAAAELCTTWLQKTSPNNVADWLEVMWQMSSAIFTGYRVHEIVPDYVDGHWLPVQVIDRPSRRFRFDADGNPLLISKGNMLGEAVPHDRFVISRHMATSTNPYGLALLSSCFWPWTFKTGGWKYFVEFCKRHGLPWPIGRYPHGTGDKEIDALAGALEAMLNSGYAVVQEGTGVEMLVPNAPGGGNLPQERLITLCNREMSKALTSQAMIGEQLSVGAKAAADTAKDRQNEVHDSDRDIAAAGISQIFRWITLYNFGDDIAAPKLEFFKKQIAGKERAETYQIAANMGAKPSRNAMLEELDIPIAEDDQDALLPEVKPAPATLAGTDIATAGTSGTSGTSDAAPASFSTPINWDAVTGFTFAKAAGMAEDEAMELAANAADQIIEDTMIAPVFQMLEAYEQQGKTLDQFRTDFANLVGEVDDEQLREVIERSLSYGLLRGRVTSAD